MCARADAGIVLNFGVLYNAGWPDIHMCANGRIYKYAAGLDSASAADAGCAAQHCTRMQRHLAADFNLIIYEG